MLKSIKFTVVLFLLLFPASSGIADEDIFLMLDKGDIAGAKKFIAETEDVNIRNGHGATPLHMAARYGLTEIAELLINASADIKIKDIRGTTPLHYAIFLPHENDEALNTDLLKNKIQIIKFLMAAGADINVQDSGGMTPLMYFTIMHKRYKSVEDTQLLSHFLEIFINSNIDLNVRDNDGMTALSWAASEADENVAAWLIQNEADVDLKDGYGMTALLWAAWESNEKIVQMLAGAGADVNAKNLIGANALWNGAAVGNLNIVLTLLEHGAEVNLHAEGITPLHAATGYVIISENEKISGESFQETIKRLGFPEDNFLRMTKALVEAGADVYAQSYPAGRNPEDLGWHERRQRMTPFDCAREIGNAEAADYLENVMKR